MADRWARPIKRYFTHHPVEYIETVMFAIGLAALLLRLGDIVSQYVGLGRSPLAVRPARRRSSDRGPMPGSARQLIMPRSRRQHCYLPPPPRRD